VEKYFEVYIFMPLTITYVGIGIE